MALVQKTNKDWWHVRRSNGSEGFVPANYVRETEPQVMRSVSKQHVKVQTLFSFGLFSLNLHL